MAVVSMLRSFGACAMNDATTLEDLHEELLDLNEKAESIQACADAEKRDLTEDEQGEIDGIFARRSTKKFAE